MYLFICIKNYAKEINIDSFIFPTHQFYHHNGHFSIRHLSQESDDNNTMNNSIIIIIINIIVIFTVIIITSFRKIIYQNLFWYYDDDVCWHDDDDDINHHHPYAGCNIGSKTLLAERDKLGAFSACLIATGYVARWYGSDDYVYCNVK